MSADSVRTAYEALVAGDIDPLVALIHPEMEWSGTRRVSRFWRPPPS